MPPPRSKAREAKWPLRAVIRLAKPPCPFEGKARSYAGSRRRLAETMSDYLVKRTERVTAYHAPCADRVTALIGGNTWKRSVRASAGKEIEHKIRNTAWLNGCVALDVNGFIETGHILAGDVKAAPCYKRPGHPRGRRRAGKLRGQGCCERRRRVGRRACDPRLAWPIS
jgi:hypothetical protein